MQFEKNEIKKSSLMKSVIEESKKMRIERGEDFFTNNKVENIDQTKITTKIQTTSEKRISNEDGFQNLRDSHTKLAQIIADSEKKIFEKNDQVSSPKKTRSKSIHLYIDEKIEHFLKTESEKAETKWGLRKNAGIGNLIQKFILNFIELKKREERQLKRVRKVIDEFQVYLVEFKKQAGSETAEIANQKMKTLSNDLNILLALLEFENGAMKSCLDEDQSNWIDLILRWKFVS